MQTGVCPGQGSVCQVNADALSNSRTRSFRHISYNDMTYIHPGAAAALMHRRGKHGPCDTRNTLITHTHLDTRAEPLAHASADVADAYGHALSA